MLEVPRQQRFVASTTVAELPYGLLLLGSSLRQGGSGWSASLDAFVVLPFDEAAARRFAEIKANLHRRGRFIEDADSQIAAVALANELTVVTDNTRPFDRFPDLRVANWLA